VKLSGIVTCVNYDDYLAWTLPHNVEHFDEFVVVTDVKDISTQKITKKCGAKCVIRSSHEPFDANGTKGMAINEGIAEMQSPEWILHLDADIILGHNFRKKLTSKFLNKDALYWVRRKQPSHESQLSVFLKNKITIHDWEGVLPEGSPQRWSGPFGYFQLFNLNSSYLKDYKDIYPEMSASKEWLGLTNEGLDFDWKENKNLTADCTDGIFNRRWPKEAKIQLEDSFTVLHLPHGPSRTNWSGRKSARFIFPDSPPGFFL
jgi:hypothetical protein